MDLNIAVVIIGFTWGCLVLLPLTKRQSIWAIFPYFGGIILTYLTLAILSDGDITQLSGGVISAIASAANGPTWQAVSIFAICITVSSYAVAAFKTWKIL